MKAAGLAAYVGELKSLGLTMREELTPVRPGPIVVSGILAEQLAKELGAGAVAGTVLVGDSPRGVAAAVYVRVVAGDPNEEDEALVRAAVTDGIPVVIVELWPQPDWTRPFVLTPFVVECRAGEGFPIGEIAERIAEATEDSSALAASVPVLAGAAWDGVVRQAMIRSALLGLMGRSAASRPLISLEQVRMTSRLRRMSSGEELSSDVPQLAAATAVVLAAGFAFRDVARRARTVLPSPLVHSAVAAGGTWLLARAARAADERTGSA